MTGDIILGKEYLFVPDEEDVPHLAHYHGRTVVPEDGPLFEFGGYVVNLDGPLYVMPHELVDPEEN